MSRYDELIQFANTHAFASKDAYDNAMNLSDAVEYPSVVVRVDENRAGQKGVIVLYIETKGRGSGQTITSIKRRFADFIEVGKNHITAWIYDSIDKQNGKVIRLKRDTIKISVIL